jgi:hypothetical protein
MAFKHKLSRRLALMRDRSPFIGALAPVVACEPALGLTNPAGHVVQLVVVPESVSLDPAQSVGFPAYGRTSRKFARPGRVLHAMMEQTP